MRRSSAPERGGECFVGLMHPMKAEASLPCRRDATRRQWRAGARVAARRVGAAEKSSPVRSQRGADSQQQSMKNLFSSYSAKTLCAATALLYSAQLSASAAVDLGSAAAHTPYDRYMGRVKQDFSAMHGGEATMDRVEALMREGRALFFTRT